MTDNRSSETKCLRCANGDTRTADGFHALSTGRYARCADLPPYEEHAAPSSNLESIPEVTLTDAQSERAYQLKARWERPNQQLLVPLTLTRYIVHLQDQISAHETTASRPFYQLLDDYFNALVRGGRQTQIDEARIAIIREYERVSGLSAVNGTPLHQALGSPVEPADRTMPAGWASMTPDQLAGAVIPKKAEERAGCTCEHDDCPREAPHDQCCGKCRGAVKASEAWVCPKCQQLNSASATTCGRCDDL